MPNTKKNMASRYATAHARRDSKRRTDTRPRPVQIDMNGLSDGRDDELNTARVAGPASVTTMPVRPLTPVAPRQGVAPRPAREPIARGPANGLRTSANRAALPLRPASALGTAVDYGHLRGDLQRILVLSASLLVLLIVLNVLLNR